MFRKLSRGQYWQRDHSHKANIVYRRLDSGIEETIQLFERERGNWTWQAARGVDAGIVYGEAPSLDSAWLMAVDGIRFLRREESDELLSNSVGG